PRTALAPRARVISNHRRSSMYDHIALKVKDLHASVSFYAAALAALGHARALAQLIGQRFGSRAPRTRRARGCISAFAQASAEPLTASTGTGSTPEAVITVDLACAPITGPATTPHSYSTQTATTSRRCARANCGPQQGFATDKQDEDTLWLLSAKKYGLMLRPRQGGAPSATWDRCTAGWRRPLSPTAALRTPAAPGSWTSPTAP